MRYLMIAMSHGFARTLYHTRHEESLYTERIVIGILGAGTNNWMFPYTLFDDCCHIERYIRGKKPIVPYISPFFLKDIKLD